MSSTDPVGGMIAAMLHAMHKPKDADGLFDVSHATVGGLPVLINATNVTNGVWRNLASTSTEHAHPSLCCWPSNSAKDITCTTGISGKLSTVLAWQLALNTADCYPL